MRNRSRLRHTTDPAVFLVPTRGYDSYAVSGEPFFDPEADERFVQELKANLPAKHQSGGAINTYQ